MMLPMLKTQAVTATCLAVICFSGGPSAQPLPVNYTVRLASATVYDTRSRGDDTAYAALSVFVNGNRTGTAIWDGKGWDGSRMEGRLWASGLHVFGTASEGSVHVSTGRLQDTDTVQIVLQILNSASPPSAANYESAADRIQQSKCTGGDGGSAWECLAPYAADLLAGWPLASCDGLVAADKLVYTAMQLRRKTETGETVTVSNLYKGASAPVACNSSIYGAIVTIARQ
jgi:hypothetical protein